MIDLNRTRADLLAEIGTGVHAGPWTELTDPRVASGDVRVRLRGHTREDLFPLLRLALSERFAAVPPRDLLRDLLGPVRHALGNACKHGNGADRTRAVSVELALTAQGAVIAVTDEGAGFDAARTLRRFREHQPYFVGQGAGFRNLHRARSTASYADGGRTFLLGYRPDGGAGRRPEPRASAARRPAAARRPLRDAGWIAAALAADGPELAQGDAMVESCRVYAADGPGGGAGDGARYAVRVVRRSGGPAEVRILTGRLHATVAAAAADVDAALALRAARISKSILVPRPVARPAEEPRLVLYEYDPWMDLREYLSHQGNREALRHAGTRVGRALARLHRSGVAPVAAPGRELFGWDCIQYGSDGRFYLYPFDRCRPTDPALDLAGYAADLWHFTLDGHDEDVYRSCLDALLSGYASKADGAIAAEALRPAVELALGERCGAAREGGA